MKKIALRLVAFVAIMTGTMLAQDITDTWQATTRSRVKPLRFVLKIFKDDSRLKADLYILEAGGGAMDGTVEQRRSSVKVFIPSLGNFEGSLSPDGSVLGGVFKTLPVNGGPVKTIILDFARATPETAWVIPEPRQPAAAGTPASMSSSGGGSDISSFAVGGVKIGMTPEEAIAALKQFDTWPILKKRYADGHLEADATSKVSARVAGAVAATWGLTGMSEDCKNRGGSPFPRPPLFVAIIAAKADRVRRAKRFPNSPFFQAKPADTADCEWEGLGMSSSKADDPEEIIVYLSPTPGSERVIGVTMMRDFVVAKPPVETVVESVRKKYQLPPSLTGKLADSIGLKWISDGQNRLLPESVVSKDDTDFGGFSNSDGTAMLPGSVDAERGIGLSFKVTSMKQNDIADFYTVALYSNKGLFAFSSEAMALQADIDKKKKQEEMDKAKKNAPAIKF